VLTATGLVPITIPPVISPLQQIVYNGSSFSVSGSAVPIRKLSIGAAYSNSQSTTIGSTISSLNKTTSYVAQLSYQFRRMGIMAGYSYFSQGISGGGAPTAGVSSYYFGISRWIKLF
jgi:predicted porin